MINNQKSVEINRLEIGEGMIDPQARVNTGEMTAEQIDTFTARVIDSVFQQTIDSKAIPCLCVDGRSERGGVKSLGPNASGGTFSLVVSDALTNNRYRKNGQKAPIHAENMYVELLKQNFKIGGHSDEHATGKHSGCGAQDKLDSENENHPSILDYIYRRGTDIRETVESLGIKVDDRLNLLIIENAKKLRFEGYATTGLDLKQAYINANNGDSSIVAVLEGAHKEVALIINTQKSTTLNRDLVQKELGANMQAFNLDVFGLKNGVEAIAKSEQEATSKFVAAMYYNVATAAVLASSSLRVVIR